MSEGTEPAEQMESGVLKISPVIGNILKGMPVPVEISGHSQVWQSIPFSEDDGSKSLAAALALTRGNGFSIYWFREPDLEKFISQAIMVHQDMRRKLAAANPLVVADSAQMAQAVRGERAVQRLITPK